MITKHTEEWWGATRESVRDFMIYDGSFRHVYTVVDS